MIARRTRRKKWIGAQTAQRFLKAFVAQFAGAGVQEVITGVGMIGRRTAQLDWNLAAIEG